MEEINRLALTFLLNALWQAPVVAAVAGACSLLLKKSPSRHRHLVWVAALALACLLPLASLFSLAESTKAWHSGALSPEQAAESDLSWFDWRESLLPAGRIEALASMPGYTLLALYALFLAWRAARLTRGGIQLRRLRAYAHEVSATSPLQSSIDRCKDELAAPDVQVAFSAAIPGPVTFGIRRPIVIMPEALSTCLPELLTAALAHEIAHVRRRDFLLNLVYQALYLPVSFHPATWLLMGRLNQTREMACDELAAATVMDPPDYARSLVNLAASLDSPGRAGYAPALFGDKNNMEERIMKLLSQSPREASLYTRALAALSILIMALAAFSASSLAFGVGQGTRSTEISGFWHLYVLQDGDQSNEGIAAHPITLVITNEDGKLNGKAIIPRVIATNDGPRLVGTVELALLSLKFDGGRFSFKVNNGEEFLIGEMGVSEDRFEGRWKGSNSKLTGQLKMTRIK
jgi:beta-lactamase regulating signal transducer with metallopeptidase domain